jgi:hypothetical protein
LFKIDGVPILAFTLRVRHLSISAQHMTMSFAISKLSTAAGERKIFPVAREPEPGTRESPAISAGPGGDCKSLTGSRTDLSDTAPQTHPVATVDAVGGARHLPPIPIAEVSKVQNF